MKHHPLTRRLRPCVASVMVGQLQRKLRRLESSTEPADRAEVERVRSMLDELF